jgi:hypothetical protein
MSGRSLGYALGDRAGSSKSALSAAVNDRCDVMGSNGGR